MQYKLTTLDDCPGEPCQFEIDSACQFVNVIRYCPLHQSAKNTGMTDQQVWDDMRKTGRDREAVRYKVKTLLGLDKQHPGVWFRTETDGMVTIGINRLGVKMPEWPNKITTLTSNIDPTLLTKVRLYG